MQVKLAIGDPTDDSILQWNDNWILPNAWELNKFDEGSLTQPYTVKLTADTLKDVKTNLVGNWYFKGGPAQMDPRPKHLYLTFYAQCKK